MVISPARFFIFPACFLIILIGFTSIAEYSGGLSRDQAEVRAYECSVGEWLRRHPVRSPAGICELCGQPKGMLTPYLTDYSIKNPGHTWLHQACSERWFTDRRVVAVQELAVLGIRNPNSL